MPEIIFEPGVHPLTEDETDDIINKTREGDADSHLWNGGVGERMDNYNPPIIAIDSMRPTDSPEDQGFDYRVSLWSSLPGKPSDINGTDEILVVAGDMTYGEADFNTVIPGYLRIATAAGGMYIGYKAGETAYKALRDKTADSELPHSWPYDWEEEELRQKVEQDPNLLTPDQMTRRRFFGRIGAGIALGAAMSGWIAAYSPFNVPKDVAASISEDYQSVSLDRLVDWDDNYKYLDGRTALLIAKLKDSMDLRGFGFDSTTRGAVLMGKDHLDQSSTLLKDSVARDRYIRQQAQLMVALAGEDTDYFTGRWTPMERMQWVIDMQRKVQIFRVTEPDEEAFKADPRAELARIIEQIDEFDSPSVTAATEGVLSIPRS
jgi:hypothetical protein